MALPTSAALYVQGFIDLGQLRWLSLPLVWLGLALAVAVAPVLLVAALIDAWRRARN